MQIHIDENKRVWLSYEYLKSVGISVFAIRNWKIRRLGSYKNIDKRAFIDYDTIPEPTREKLYNKAALIHLAKEDKYSFKESLFYKQLQDAYSGIATAKWRNLMLEEYPDMETDQLTEYSRKAAVIERAFTLEPMRHGNLECLFRAYSRIYKGAYSSKSRFCKMLKAARNQGILHVAIDKRILNYPEPIHGADVQLWAAYYLNHSKCFTQKMSYEYFVEICEEKGKKVPSYNWFISFYKKHKNTLDQNRYGQMEFERLNQNFAKIIPALYAGDQWQMDGWRIPVYCKEQRDGKTVHFVTYYLFAVLDAHSRKIIGCFITDTEDTQSILKGIEKAVKNTCTLPFEIVADNHSFNKTKEAGNFKEQLERFGVTWTTDSNPRRKALLERAFRTLGEKFFKKQYGYIGQGIRTREKGGRTQQELLDLYTKPDNLPVKDQIVALTLEMINQYNSSFIKILNDSPNNLYQKSEQPNAVKITEFQRLQLFTLKSEHKITHGQITIQRSGHRYEYQLPAEFSHPYNNQAVTVRYADFEEIYLYDLKTDKPICSVVQKIAIHGALANQTEKDKELLFKNKGRIKGINARIKKQKQQIIDNAIDYDNSAYEGLNVLRSQKELIQKLQTDYELRQNVRDHGIDPDQIQELPNVSENLENKMKPGEKENRHPFYDGEGSMKKITIDLNGKRPPSDQTAFN